MVQRGANSAQRRARMARVAPALAPSPRRYGPRPRRPARRRRSSDAAVPGARRWTGDRGRRGAGGFARRNGRRNGGPRRLRTTTGGAGGADSEGIRGAGAVVPYGGTHGAGARFRDASARAGALAQEVRLDLRRRNHSISISRCGRRGHDEVVTDEGWARRTYCGDKSLENPWIAQENDDRPNFRVGKSLSYQ